MDQELTSHALDMQQRAAGGREMTSWPPSWKYDVTSQMRLSRIHLKNNPIPNFIPNQSEISK